MELDKRSTENKDYLESYFEALGLPKDIKLTNSLETLYLIGSKHP